MFDTVSIVDDTGPMVLPASDKYPEGHIRSLRSTDLDVGNIIRGERVTETLRRVDMLDAFCGGGPFFEDHIKDELSPRLELLDRYREQDAAYKTTHLKDRARLKKPQPPKKFNIIVITDGQADDKQELEDLIVDTAQELDRLRAPAAQIGIHSVLIGEDESARSI